MGQDFLARVSQRSDELREAWNKLYVALEDARTPDGSGFDTTIPIPGLELAIDDLTLQISIIAAELGRLGDTTSEALIGTPPMALRRLEESLEKAISASAGILESLEKNLKSLNSNSFQGSIQVRQQSSRPTNINFAEKFVAFARELDNAFVRLQQIKITLPKPKQRLELTDIVGAVRHAAAEGKAALKELSECTDEAKNKLIAAGVDAEKARDLASDAEGKHQEVVELKSSVEQAFREVEEANDTTKEIVEHAGSLKNDIENYQPQFESFQNALDGYKEEIRTGTVKKNELIEALECIRAEIKEKNEKASAMLSNATVAGLAASFGTTRDKLDKELGRARVAFYVSIALLIVLALPMVFYIVPNVPWGGPSLERGEAGIGGIFGEIVARMTILFPGVLFVSFASRRHSSLFRLREQYEYKYNMAVSVEGFKQQAEDIADAIAGTTFYEILTRNPADAMDGGRAGFNHDQPNPLVKAVRHYLEEKSSPRDPQN